MSSTRRVKKSLGRCRPSAKCRRFVELRARGGGIRTVAREIRVRGPATPGLEARLTYPFAPSASTTYDSSILDRSTVLQRHTSIPAWRPDSRRRFLLFSANSTDTSVRSRRPRFSGDRPNRVEQPEGVEVPCLHLGEIGKLKVLPRPEQLVSDLVCAYSRIRAR